MKREIRGAVVAIACMAAMGAGMAQTKKRPPTTPPPVAPWIEPTSFLGVELGKALAEQTSVITECPTKPISASSTYTTLDWSYKGFCYEIPPAGGHKFRPARNGPDIGVGYSMTLILADEVVQGVMLTVYRLGKDQFVALLKARYGEPHATELAQFQNRMGASFTGAVLTWDGPKVHVSFSEYGSKIDESSFQIFLRSAQAVQTEKDNEKAKQYKGKL